MDPAAVVQFSFLDLFMKADWVVKSVMIGLGLASVWSWAVAVDKWRQITALEKGARAMEDAFAEGRGLEAAEEAGRAGEATGRVLASGLAEVRAARRAGALNEARIDRTIDQMGRAMAAGLSRELARAERGMGVLATIGSSSPFIGLFGTVWGIMNAFRSIAASKDTNLAVVAPGIAEALFATALGLLAAIPAVIFYNWLTGKIDSYATRVEALSDDVVTRTVRRLSDGA
jgi:biopolymer transport protein TolQ